MKYRVLKPLSTGHKAGEIIDSSDLASRVIAPLLRTKAISQVAFPPLVILPGWSHRAARLSKLGIVGVGEFLDADSEKLAAAFRYKPATIDRWKREALAAANVKIEQKIRKCRRNR